VIRICKIEEEQTTQWPKDTKEVIRICKIEEEQTTQWPKDTKEVHLFLQELVIATYC
jgi:hypothetical protein